LMFLRILFSFSFPKNSPNNLPINYSTYHVFFCPTYSLNLKTRLIEKLTTAGHDKSLNQLLHTHITQARSFGTLNTSKPLSQGASHL
jgi:hypothetical protein